MSSSEVEPTATPEAELPKPPKKVRFLRLKAAVALPLLIGAAIIAYWLMIDGVIADQLVAQGKAYAGKGGQAQVGSVHFSIFGPQLQIDELRVWQDLGDGREHEVAYLGSAKLDIEFWPLLERRFVVNDISATAIRYQGPRKEPAESVPADVPTDTNQPELNDYLKQVKDILQSEEINSLRDWMEKLQEYMKEKESEPESEPAEAPPPA